MYSFFSRVFLSPSNSPSACSPSLSYPFASAIVVYLFSFPYILFLVIQPPSRTLVCLIADSTRHQPPSVRDLPQSAQRCHPAPPRARPQVNFHFPRMRQTTLKPLSLPASISPPNEVTVQEVSVLGRQRVILRRRVEIRLSESNTRGSKGNQDCCWMKMLLLRPQP